jgi:hypothetical protein
MKILKLFSKKKPQITRIASKSVTDTIARAMEEADRIKVIVIVYETLDGDDSPGGLLLQDDVEFSTINWLLDQAKKWVIE